MPQRRALLPQIIDSIPGDTKGKVLLYLHIDRWASQQAIQRCFVLCPSGLGTKGGAALASPGGVHRAPLLLLLANRCPHMPPCSDHTKGDARQDAAETSAATSLLLSRQPPTSSHHPAATTPRVTHGRMH